LPDLQFLTADRMSLVMPFSSNGWTIPLNYSRQGEFGQLHPEGAGKIANLFLQCSGKNMGLIWTIAEPFLYDTTFFYHYSSYVNYNFNIEHLNLIFTIPSSIIFPSTI
jgi:hypothetical protein